MPGTQYIPKAFAALAGFLTNLLNKVSAAQSRLGILAADLAAYQAVVNAYLAANAIADNPAATSVERLARKLRAEEATAATRDFVNSNLRYNHAMTDEDRLDMGLVIPDHQPTPVPVPATTPEAKVYHPATAKIEIRFHDSESGNKAKPAGVHGAEIAWGILDTEPTSWKDLNRSSFATHSPLKLTFDIEDLGKTFYFALRWENNRGEKGDWTPIEKTIIS